MNHSISLQPNQRQYLLLLYRSSTNPQLRLRAHILLLLDDGRTWNDIASTLYCSTRTIARWRRRFHAEGLDGLPGQPTGVPRRLSSAWATIAVFLVLKFTPRSFGLFRSRWCCASVAWLLNEQYQVVVSRETVRQWLHEGGLVWRRPRPFVDRTDPQREEILEQLRSLLRDLPEDETVVFQDEVDLNLNPEVGSMWMRKSAQAMLPTPGDNQKCYLAGSLHWRTGKLFETVGPKRNGELFVRHLEQLRRQLRRYRKIHVICDNAKFHKEGAVVKFLAAHGDRVKLHYLPKYAPECNPIERVWWRLREAITRNHRCASLNELVELTLGWLTERGTFRVRDSVYEPPPAA